MPKIKVGIIDDHGAIAQGISLEIAKSKEYEVLFIASKKEEIIEKLREAIPDVLIMDVVMPGSSGIETFKQVLHTFSQIKIIAYTALNSPVIIEQLLRAGVRGYVSKNQPLPELIEAISEVHYDRISLPADYNFIKRKIKIDDVPEELSRREIEILELIAAEKKSPEIAEILDISVNTVETHRKHLFDKLKVTNAAGLIKAGYALGYIK